MLLCVRGLGGSVDFSKPREREEQVVASTTKPKGRDDGGGCDVVETNVRDYKSLTTKGRTTGNQMVMVSCNAHTVHTRNAHLARARNAAFWLPDVLFAANFTPQES